MSDGLNELLSIKNSQRLSLHDVQRYWNHEYHVNAGHKLYESRDIFQPQPASKNTLENVQAVTEIMTEFNKRGSWVDQSGDKAKDQDYLDSLIGFINKGHLPVYLAENPSIQSCAPDDLIGVNFKKEAGKYFIDKDDLGLLLTRYSYDLPDFWYELDENDKYITRLKLEDETGIEKEKQLEALIEENRELRAELNRSRPYLNPDHKCFSPELEAAIVVWLAKYENVNDDEKVIAKKPALESWLKENRKDVVINDSGEVSKRALERIVMVANPSKEGGRPSKN